MSLLWRISQYSSVTQLCPSLCDPMDYSTPGFPVHHQLLKLPQTHIHWVGDAIQPTHPVIPFSSCLQSFPTPGSFLMSQFSLSGGQSIGASASVLLINIQDWFPLGLTDFLGVQGKSLQHHSSSLLSLLYGPTLTSIHDYWKKHSFD